MYVVDLVSRFISDNCFRLRICGLQKRITVNSDTVIAFQNARKKNM